MGRCTQSVYFYCLLNHCPPTLAVSLNCQEAAIFLPDIWISLPNPLNFSIIQYRVRDREGGGEEQCFCRLICSYPIQSKISFKLWCVTLKPFPPLGFLVGGYGWSCIHTCMVFGHVHTMDEDNGVCFHACVMVCVDMQRLRLRCLPVSLQQGFIRL